MDRPALFAEYVKEIIAFETGHDDVYTATALIATHVDEALISTSGDQVTALGVRRRNGGVEWFTRRHNSINPEAAQPS